MNRGKIKIIEFGMDDDDPSPKDVSGGGGLKIIEFDNEPQESPKRVATAKDVGHIKIIEFDDDRTAKRAPPPERPRRAVGPVKIREFDKEDEPEGRGSIGVGAKIKIVEFD